MPEILSHSLNQIVLKTDVLKGVRTTKERLGENGVWEIANHLDRIERYFPTPGCKACRLHK